MVHATNDETSEGGISYFVANANINAKPTPGSPGAEEEGGTSLVLTEKVDSRIYGSKDFKYIQVSEVNEISDPDVLAAGNTMYTFDVLAEDNEAAQNKKDSRLARNYKLRFEANIVDCGYVVDKPSGKEYISYKPVKAVITTTDKDGQETEKTIDFVNVYGAKPKAGAVIIKPEVG